MPNTSLRLAPDTARERGRRRPSFVMTENGQSPSFLIDQLLQSHTELSSALRLAGRRILRYAPEDDGSLERIRKTLKRADHLRQAILGPVELDPIAENTDSVFDSGEPLDEQLPIDFGPDIS